LLIAMAVQAAWWYSARSAALASAQEGLRVARSHNGSTASGREAAVRFAGQVAGGQLLSPTAAVSTAAGQTIVVRVDGEAPSFVPGLRVHVSQQARAPKERWTDASDNSGAMP
jgi:hypothetical protein